MDVLWLTLVILIMLNHFVAMMFYRQLRMHLMTNYNPRYRSIHSDTPALPPLGNVIRMHRYAWSSKDDDDPRVFKLKRRLRISQIVFFTLFVFLLVLFFYVAMNPVR